MNTQQLIGNIEAEDSDESEEEEFKEENILAINKHFRNRKVSNKGKNSRMSPEMQADYRDALKNVFFGQFEEASKKLKNLIRLYPDNPDAFHLLGTMHEQLGQLQNAVEYFFMSTYLSPPSIEKWIKVADLSLDLKMYTQAAYCYGRALKIQNYNIQLMTKRAQAFQLSQQTKKAINLYKKILSTTKSLPVIKKYAKIRFKRGEYQNAREILQSYQNLSADPNITYMICQTYLKEQNYQKMLEYIQDFLIQQQGSESMESLNQIQKGQQIVASSHFNFYKISQNVIKQLPVGFLKLLYIGCKKLGVSTFGHQNQISLKLVEQSLIQGYTQNEAEAYQQILRCFDSTPMACKNLLKFLLLQTQKSQKDKSKSIISCSVPSALTVHQNIKNYLSFSQVLKAQHRYEECIDILKQVIAKQEFNSSQELMTQLNHIKVISGYKQPLVQHKKQFNNKAKQFASVTANSNSNVLNDEDIFYSDDEGQNYNQNNQQNQDKMLQLFPPTSLNGNHMTTQNNNNIRNRYSKRKNSLKCDKQASSQDPIVLRRVLENCKETIESILQRLQQHISQNQNKVDHFNGKNTHNNFRYHHNVSNHDLNRLISFRQIEQSVRFVVNLKTIQYGKDRKRNLMPSASSSSLQRQREGLFNKHSSNGNNRGPYPKKRIRRYHISSKAQQTHDHQETEKYFIIINQILASLVEYLKILLKYQLFLKCKYLCQLLSKAHFFRWQNKSPELRRHKQTVYTIGILCCLNLGKYETATFFIRYLIKKNPENSFYLLIINFLIHNSESKAVLSSLLTKNYFNEDRNTNNSQRQVHDKFGSSYNELQSHQSKSNQMKLIPQSSMQKQSRVQKSAVNLEEYFFQEEEQDIKQLLNKNSQKNNNMIDSQENLQNQSIAEDDSAYEISHSLPQRKMSNVSEFIRSSGKLSYLCGIEYMETGYFDLAIKALIKSLAKLQQSQLCLGSLLSPSQAPSPSSLLPAGSIIKTIWLCLTSCFLQISSSRTTHNKLTETNRSSYCLLKYLIASSDRIQKNEEEGDEKKEIRISKPHKCYQSLFNKARWFAQIRMNQKAIQCFQEVLQLDELPQQLKFRSAMCLMCIYKDIENWQMVNNISQKYFSVTEQKQGQMLDQKIQQNNDEQYLKD